MKQTAPLRQKIAAEQIKEVLKKRGLSRKQFADLMRRGPSEVTKWLSGNHNFTIALLQEISETLESEITGVEYIKDLIDECEDSDRNQTLTDPAVAYGNGAELYNKIRRRSSYLGMSARQYIEKLVDEDLQNSRTLPKVEFPLRQSAAVEKYAGIIKAKPSQDDFDNDERLSRIWNR